MTKVIQLFQEIQKCIVAEKYTNAIEFCNKVLSNVAGDEEAIKVKCICYMKMKKYGKAVEIATKYGHILGYEKAYCHYRRNEFMVALETIQDVLETNPSKLSLHLKAQILYKMEKYLECVEVYKYLKTITRNEMDRNELHVNLCAAVSAAEKQDEIETVQGKGYEIWYNQACVQVKNGNLETALRYLEKAQVLCETELTQEGLSSEEMQRELEIVLVQIAYVHQLCGNDTKALSIYRSVLKSSGVDAVVSIIAMNNIVAMRQDKDLFDSYKKFKSMPLEAVDTKLSNVQKETIGSNHALLLCMVNKGKECRVVLEKLKQSMAESTMPLKVSVAMLLKEKKWTECIALLEAHQNVSEQPLLLAHVHLLSGSIPKAIKALESIELQPGIIATIVALHQKNGCAHEGLQALKNAREHYAKYDPKSPAALQVEEGYAALALQRGEYENAIGVLEELVQSSSAVDGASRVRALAYLVVALSYVDASRAEVKSMSLPSVDESTVDAAQLELDAPRVSKTSVSKFADRIADVEEQRKSRKRQSRNPDRIARKRLRRKESYLKKVMSKPDYNPHIGLVKPDAERWIARKQRSYTRRKSRGKFVGPQGGGANKKDLSKLDARNRTMNASNEPSTVLRSSRPSAALRKSSKKKRR